MLTVRHTTVYRYRQPVRLEPHRLLLRPRDSHDLRLLDAKLTLSPAGTLRWHHDVFDNSVAVACFAEPSAELRIESELQLERFSGVPRPQDLDPGARRYPFAYSGAERIDLGGMALRLHTDRNSRLRDWAQSYVAGRSTDTMALLADLNLGIRASFAYEGREAEGTQTPTETLDRGRGCCRDFAVLLVDAVRALGFAARVVTGYLYSSAFDRGFGGAQQGAGATHAWADIYLPGAGWIAFDPTNGAIDSPDLIRVAVAREIAQAAPISGSFVGCPDDYLGMTVDVAVTSSS